MRRSIFGIDIDGDGEADLLDDLIMLDILDEGEDEDDDDIEEWED